MVLGSAVPDRMLPMAISDYVLALGSPIQSLHILHGEEQLPLGLGLPLPELCVLYGRELLRENRECDLYNTRTLVIFPSNRHAIHSGHGAEFPQQPFSRLLPGNLIQGGEMKIACCTVEMVALIFLLFVSINGAYSYTTAPARENLVSRPTTELVSAWGEPDSVATATDVGFASSQLAEVEIWSYYKPARSVSVRNNVVMSIRWG